MASCSWSRRDDAERSPCPAEAPSFFKIVLQSALLDGRLVAYRYCIACSKFGYQELPQAVVTNHGKCLADSIYLKVPSGARWQIQVTGGGGQAWLQKGWPEFAKFYSLEHGYLLVFSSEDDYSCFQVRIFGWNNVEIHYPHNSTHSEEPNLCGRFYLPEMEELGNDDSVQFLDSTAPKSTARTSLLSHQPCKLMRTSLMDKAKRISNPRGKTESEGRKHGGENKIYASGSYPKNWGGGGGDISNAAISSGAPKIAKGNTAYLMTRAFTRARSFESENPFFVLVMQPTYISHYLRLPLPFTRQHICAKGVHDMILQISDGRTWPAQCAVVTYQKTLYARVYDGWRSFVRENHLKLGDACVFELIDRGSKVTFKVGIYRAHDAD